MFRPAILCRLNEAAVTRDEGVGACVLDTEEEEEEDDEEMRPSRAAFSSCSAIFLAVSISKNCSRTLIGADVTYTLLPACIANMGGVYCYLI